MIQPFPTSRKLPQSDRQGWPWTEQSLALPNANADKDMAWPRISIITPTFNRAEFLEQAIRSALLQGYPNLQYIVIDGGSTDGSIEIIKKYEPWIDYWVSEKDRGQSHAINKGMEKADGELLSWINSDDLYQPNALKAVAEEYLVDSSAGLIFGDARYLDQQGNLGGSPNLPTQLDYDSLIRSWGPVWIFQPASFFSSQAWERCGHLDESLELCMDTDLFLKIAKAGFTIRRVEPVLAHAIYHPSAKTTAMREYQAVEHVLVLLGRHGMAAEESAMFYLKVHLADRLVESRRLIAKITENPVYKFFRPIYRSWKALRHKDS